MAASLPSQEEKSEISVNIQENESVDQVNQVNLNAMNLGSRSPTNTTGTGGSLAGSYFNLINVVSGLGVLSMPYAVSQGGWLSLTIFLLMGLVCSYTGILIQRCMRANQSIESYPQIGRYAFGQIGQNIIAIFIYMELYLVAVSFLIIEGDNLNKLFPKKKLQIFSFINLEGEKLFILLSAGIIWPTTWLKDLKKIAFLSVVGSLTMAVLTGVLIWGVIDNGGFHHVKREIFNIRGLPNSLGLYLVCFSGHPVFPTIYSSMKKKQQFSKVMSLSMILCTLNYTVTAVLGYLLYGNDVQSQVTLNLPSEKIYAKVAIYTTLINPLVKYSILIFPIASAIEDRISLTFRRSIGLVIRTLVLLSTIILAATLPFFGDLMTFIGSFLNVMVSVMFPCLCYLKIYGNFRAINVEFVAVLLILIMGALVAVTGTYTSVRDIVSKM